MRRRSFLRSAPVAALPLIGALGACSKDGGSTGASLSSSAGHASSGAPTSPAAPAPSPTDRYDTLLDGREAHLIAAQLVLVGMRQGDQLPSDALKGSQSGGMFLLGRWNSASEVTRVLGDARAANRTDIGHLFAVDQEGGEIQVLTGDAARSVNSASTLAGRGADAVRQAYRGIGEDLAKLGIGTDLAPVADLVDPTLGRANAPVGALHRGFGTDAQTAGACVEAAVAGLADAHVQSTLKHFPGLGAVRENTDFAKGAVVDSVTAADGPQIEVFRRGIAAGARAVMLSSATYSRIDPNSPGMFSRAVVTDLLRGTLGFDGVAMSDDIGAAGAVQSIPVAERATRFLEAGGDLLLTADASLAARLTDALAAWSGASPANAARLRESAARVLALKEAAGVLTV